jgi:lipoprotein-anchoring transpeptidase ErfK/SrfK
LPDSERRDANRAFFLAASFSLPGETSGQAAIAAVFDISRRACVNLSQPACLLDDGEVRMRRDRSVAAIAGLVAGAAVIAGPHPDAQARELVTFERADYPAGAIVVSTRERRLYLTLGDGTALRYRVAVGKAGKQWFGVARIDGKHVRPAWSPPAEVKRDNPRLPDLIPGGAPNNPMGAAALTLDRGQYAIHGTSRTMRGSIGSAASYGCIRMLDEDIVDLFARVRVGTPVVVVR